MKKKYEAFGIDLGNSDTKSQDTVTPNGFSKHKEKPSMAKEYLFWEGEYYCPSEKRFNYVEDKTKSNRGLILALFGISKQILSKAKQKKKTTKEEIQNYINQIDTIILGVDLPLTHMKKKKDMEDYFYKHLGNQIRYVYNDYEFNFRMDFCKCFPQNYAAMCTNGDDEVIIKYKKYYAADIGGETLDGLPFVNGKPLPEGSISENVGILSMYKNIIHNIKRDFNVSIENADIEDVLKGYATVLPENVKSEIISLTQTWVDEQIVDLLVQNEVKLETTYIIFFGGGSVLLKKFLKKNSLLKNIHFLKNPVKANARGCAILVEKMYMEYLESRGK